MTRKQNEKDNQHKDTNNELNKQSINSARSEIGAEAEFDKKIQTLDEKIQSLEKEKEEYKDKLLRKAAEFENYKRRSENDQLNLLKYTGEMLIVKLLPVIDDLERSLQHIGNAKENSSINEGIKLVYDKLMKILGEQGVKKIEAVGKPFDVEYHEALLQRKDETVPPHTVIEELEKGYIYKDRVIRHAKVIVSEDSEHSADSTNQAESSEKEKNENNFFSEDK